MTVTIIPTSESPDLTPTKRRKVFLVNLSSKARYEVLSFNPKSKELVLRAKGKTFNTHWNETTIGKYAVEYVMRGLV